MYIQRWDEPKEKHTRVISLVHLEKVCILRTPINYGGCLTVRKKWLLEINGYEQHPAFAGGFHVNGNDVYTRLKNLGLHIKWHPTERLYHPWHPRPLHSSEDDLKTAEERGYWQRKIAEERGLALTTRAYFGLDGQYCPASQPADLAQSNVEKAIGALRSRGLFRGTCFVIVRAFDRLRLIG